jgi:transcriptional regulator with XRE-family HTH domain
MDSTVKFRTQVGIDDRLDALRLQLMTGELALRFGQRLRQRRLELGLTQPQLAARIAPHAPERAVDKQRVSDWERGINLPDDGYKAAIVKATEVPDVSYFYEMGDDEERETPDPFAGTETSSSDQLTRIEETLDVILGVLERQVGADVLAAVREEQSQARGSRSSTRRHRAA